MKTKTIYYLASVLLFVVLFYHQNIGLNVSLLTMALLTTSYYVQAQKGINRNYKFAFWGGILGAFSFAYYGDFFSFMVLFCSLHWVAMLMFDPNQKLVKLFVLAPLNYLTSLPNILESKPKIPPKNSQHLFKSVMAYVLIPLGITSLFVFVYISSSDVISDFLSTLSFTIDIQLSHILWLVCLGSVFMYFFWYFKLPKKWQIVNTSLNDDYATTSFVPTYTFDMARKSAEITFVMLNISLFIFIIIYGIENLFTTEEINSISSNLHKRIYAVILSILMAISLILYFFRGAFNFDKQNAQLKRFIFIWIGLNSLLVFIALAKNIEYVYMLGLTEKRLGVFLFLILSWIGLYLTFKKVRVRKTNWFLINRMTTITFATFVLISLLNWGWIITKFNIETGIDIESDLSYYTYNLSGNDVVLYDYFKSKNKQEEIALLKMKYTYNEGKINLSGKLQSIYTKYILEKREN